MDLVNLNLPAIVLLVLLGVATAVAWARGKRMAVLEMSWRDLRNRLRDERRSLRSTEQQKAFLEESEQETEELSRVFVVTLPELIRQLTANREKRNVAPLLIRMFDVLLEPEQIGVFLRSAVGDSYILSASRGMPDGVGEGDIEIADGEGPLGWVARNQTAVEASEIRLPLDGGRPEFMRFLKADFIAPLVDPDDNTTLGVVTIGGAIKHGRFGKKIVKMIASLGTLALKNVRYHKHLQMAANQDGLTGLYNKKHGTFQLSISINQAELADHDLSILLFDLDHFKKYNDTRGHLSGDDCLRGVGEIVRRFLRADDFAVRFGGEEFLVVMHDTDKAGAVTAAEKIRALIEEHRFPGGPGQLAGRVTISGGVASLRDDADGATELIRLADEALYEAKGSGRNQVLAYRAQYLAGGSEAVPG